MAAAPLLAQAGGQAAGLANTPQNTARRKLGKLEVSSIGLGVQNMSRNDQTTVPNRAQIGGLKLALKGRVANLSEYETVYLGFPIWGETAPPVIRSFLASHKLAGKKLIPFITHGGDGVGDRLNVVAAHAPGARLREALVMQGDQERQTALRVMRWLG